MILKQVFLLLLVLVTVGEISAQNYPIYNGYFLNPYIYNPAAAATERFQINAAYRKQWLGIQGAPTISSLTATTLLDGTRAGVGLRVSTFSRGILNSTDASVSYAYGVPLSKKNKLFFGMSGGLLSNTVNLKDVPNSSDPAIANINSSMVPTASFGVLYKNTNGLNFGFALPKLIGTQTLDSKYALSFYDNMIFSASFSKWELKPKSNLRGKGRGKVYGRSKKNSNVPLELFGIYRYSSIGGLLEATGKFNFNSNLWLSATYRQYAGIIPGIGINANNISFSYFYEPGVGGNLPLKTHEVLLNIRLGSGKKFRDKKPAPLPSKVSTAPVKVIAKNTTPAKKVEEKKTEPIINKVEEKKTLPIATKAPAQEAKAQQVKNNVPPKDEPKVEEKSFVKVQKKDTARGGPRMRAHTDLIAEQQKAESDPQHLEEQEKIKRLEQHADNPTEEHANETVHPHAERHEFVKKGSHQEEMDYGDYVIVGVFKGRANAEHFSNGLNKMAFTSEFGFLTEKSIWYVYIVQTNDINEAKAERDKYRKLRIFRDAWLLTVHK